jgi:hypothetical protein
MAAGDKRTFTGYDNVPVTVIDQGDGTFLPLGGAASNAYADTTGTASTVKRAKSNIAASQTDSIIVAAVSGKKIRILALSVLTGATATTITFNSKSAQAGSAISCLYANAANGGLVLPYNPLGWFETVLSEGFSATTGAGATTGVHVVYVEV